MYGFFVLLHVVLNYWSVYLNFCAYLMIYKFRNWWICLWYNSVGQRIDGWKNACGGQNLFLLIASFLRKMIHFSRSSPWSSNRYISWTATAFSLFLWGIAPGHSWPWLFREPNVLDIESPENALLGSGLELEPSSLASVPTLLPSPF